MTDKRVIPMIPPPQRGAFPAEQRLPAESIAQATTACTSCGAAGCHTNRGIAGQHLSGCPMENNIPEINRLYQQGIAHELAGDQARAEQSLRQAFAVSWRTNRWGLLTGRLCPSDQLCEGGCIYKDTAQGSILIRGIEYDLHARAWEHGWVPPLKQMRANGQSIGIVGSGFGALSAAEIGFERGYSVTIYERAALPGGLGAAGIPSLKIAYEDVQRYWERLGRAGVTVRTDTAIDDLTPLLEAHDAIIIATGKYKPKRALGDDQGGAYMVQAIDFLSRQSWNEKGIAHAYDDALDAQGKDVIVIGGGDTAMDCVRTAKTLQGAQSAKCLYRSSQETMRAGMKEIEAATQEGIGFVFDAQPMRIDQGPSGSLSLQTQDGRVFEGDMIISAIGFDPENPAMMFGSEGLPINAWGGLETLPDQRVIIPGTDPFDTGIGVPMAGICSLHDIPSGRITPIAGVGDIVGSSLAVHALAGGRDIVSLIETVMK